MNENGATILQGDCRQVLKTLEPESVHCCVTSPPYWNLRDYQTAGQIGLEVTIEAHLAALVEVFGEVRRVLRKDGTLWLNYGDCYASAWPCSRRNVIGNGSLENGKREARAARLPGGLKEKDLMGMPWRVAFALQADSWYLRCDCIWSKPNPMPESVTDRPTRAHEYLFLLTKEARYFYDADAVREPNKKNRDWPTWEQRKAGGAAIRRGDPGKSGDVCHWAGVGGNPAGRNKRSVWEIASQPTPEAHFATFPEALVEPCILAGTSERGCCPACGAPWERVVEKRVIQSRPMFNGKSRAVLQGGDKFRASLSVNTTGWAPTCRCPHEETDCVPCVVLDPFFGSGTVGKVATRLGRRSIGIDLNPDYVAMAEERNAQLGLML